MKYYILAAAFMVLTIAPALGQSKADAPVQNTGAQEDRMKQDVRAVSGMLKETYSMVDMQIANVSKQLTTATGQDMEKLATTKEELTAWKGQLEQMLSMVNSASPEDWGKVRSKAETMNTMVRDDLAKLK